MNKVELHLKFGKSLSGYSLSADEGVKTNIYRVGNITKGATKSSANLLNITIPVGIDENYKILHLQPGDYLVECVLPSGEMVRKDIHLTEGPAQKINLLSESSPKEFLSWQKFSGELNKQELYNSRIEKGQKNILRNRTIETSPELPSDWVWTKILHQESHRSAVSIEEIDDLVLKGLIEVGPGSFRNQYLEEEKQWSYLKELLAKNESTTLLDLLSLSHQAYSVAPDAAENGLRWQKPSIEDEEVNFFEINHKEPDLVNMFLVWTPNGNELVLLPNRWEDIRGSRHPKIDLTIDLTETAFEFRVNTIVHNTFLGSALAYLSSGSLPTAKMYVEKASEMLFMKMSNPYSAAAGALILLETLDWKAIEAGSSEYLGKWNNWKNWIRNLYRRFPWLPDGAVLHGWSLLYQEEQEEAKSIFKEAYQRGVPLYSAVLKKLLEGLDSFEDEEFKSMARTVRSISWRMNPQQVFTTFRLGPTLSK